MKNTNNVVETTQNMLPKIWLWKMCMLYHVINFYGNFVLQLVVLKEYRLSTVLSHLVIKILITKSLSIHLVTSKPIKNGIIKYASMSPTCFPLLEQLIMFTHVFTVCRYCTPPSDLILINWMNFLSVLYHTTPSSGYQQTYSLSLPLSDSLAHVKYSPSSVINPRTIWDHKCNASYERQVGKFYSEGIPFDSMPSACEGRVIAWKPERGTSSKLFCQER